MKIVVIGGSGLIGSKLVSDLRSRGHETQGGHGVLPDFGSQPDRRRNDERDYCLPIATEKTGVSSSRDCIGKRTFHPFVRETTPANPTTVAECRAATRRSDGRAYVQTRARIAQIVDAFPRLEMKDRFTRAVCGIVETRASTTYDNFARDFGERFVPGYKRPSTVDFLLGSPFSE